MTISFKRSSLSLLLKLLTVLLSSTGMTLAFVFAVRDGYTHPLYRLLYFTNLSNIWITLSCLSLMLLPIFRDRRKQITVSRLYTLKYIFTVSISITGIVFCCFLAPFAKGYEPWTISNVLTHVAVPILAALDLVVDPAQPPLKKRDPLLALIPLVLYLAAASVLIILKVDFGRGDPFPYFFLNYHSPAGVFGFSDEPPYIIGSFYWIVLFLFTVLGVAKLLARATAKSAKDAHRASKD